MEKTKSMRYLLIIIGLSFIIYANTLNNEFVSDDIPGIAHNPDISSPWVNLNPSLVLNSLNYLMGGLNPPIYHLTNIIVHSLNSVLVFFFLCLFFKPALSFWGGLIFAAHPIHTEAVTWIAGRPYSLSAVFMLLSLLLYIKSTSPPKLKWLKVIGALFFYGLAFSTCVFALIFPVLLVLYDFTFAKWRKTWKLWLAFFALAGLKLCLMTSPIKDRIAQVAFDTGSTGMTNPLFNAAFSIFAHLSLLLWPKNLTLYHEPLVISPIVLGIEVFVLAILVLLLPLIFKKHKLLFFSIIFFIIFLLPTYSPVTISWLVAERYLYFSSITFSIWLLILLAKYSPGGKKINPAATIFLILLTSVYSMRTIARNFDWKSHAGIWRATVKTSPLSPRAHNNMGDVYAREGNLEKAVEEFSRAIELKPDYADAYHNLANTYEKMARIEEAAANYKKAIAINPRLWQSYQNLGAIYFNQGFEGLAKDYLKKAQDINPDNPAFK